MMIVSVSISLKYYNIKYCHDKILKMCHPKREAQGIFLFNQNSLEPL